MKPAAPAAADRPDLFPARLALAAALASARAAVADLEGGRADLEAAAALDTVELPADAGAPGGDIHAVKVAGREERRRRLQDVAAFLDQGAGRLRHAGEACTAAREAVALDARAKAEAGRGGEAAGDVAEAPAVKPAPLAALAADAREIAEALEAEAKSGLLMVEAREEAKANAINARRLADALDAYAKAEAEAAGDVAGEASP